MAVLGISRSRRRSRRRSGSRSRSRGVSSSGSRRSSAEHQTTHKMPSLLGKGYTHSSDMLFSACLRIVTSASGGTQQGELVGHRYFPLMTMVVILVVLREGGEEEGRERGG